MNIKNKIKRLQLSCPDVYEVEKLLLKAHKSPLLFKAFEEHIAGCSKCFRIVRRIHKFYEILDTEIQQVASPKVVSFAEDMYAAVKEAENKS